MSFSISSAPRSGPPPPQQAPPTNRPTGPASPGAVEAAMRDLGVEAQPEQEDTMTNLRKTFAGIFGDM